MTDTRPTDALRAHNPIFKAILMVFTDLNYTPLQEVVNARRRKMRKGQLSWPSKSAPESRNGTLHSSSLQFADYFVK